jgi:hypothetical protein
MAKMTRDSGDLEATKAMLGAGVGSALMPDGNALGLHFVMFVPTIMGQVILIDETTDKPVHNDPPWDPQTLVVVQKVVVA